MNQRQINVNENNSYNGAKSPYHGKKKTYNDAITAEQDRQKDFFKATFEPKIAIPTRPEQPTQPMAYMGAYIAADGDTKGLAAKAADQKGSAMFTSNSNKELAGDSFRKGYLISTTDNSLADGKMDSSVAAHAFGRLGQGDASNPSKGAKGWYYGAKSSTGNAPGMMISYYPKADGDAGLAKGKTIKTNAQPISWAGLGDFASPGQPGAAAAPMDAGAAGLYAGAAATLLAVSVFGM